MRGKIFQGVKPVVIAIATVVVLGLSAFWAILFQAVFQRQQQARKPINISREQPHKWGVAANLKI